ncbi:RabGAP/TBC [Saitoella complicata NRRL Y-17804]|uniref:RabGAP/TBC n=1 Tax=Saitoella complicata (strain BCRC 22490 / CBS 7301 / JCM 7358 / NBRC 10748 / NRRL Y-17804) TaxID=698492 RepID=UPI00086755E3|nr:RabGAP/TBC [Saitoella complicata NRRL Y-17804]ODQ51842.1 RabGAP/TBC [Saitoella complicata NRRL Y-17804]
MSLDGEDYDILPSLPSTPSNGIKLLFSKSKVYVHPTSRSKDNVPGFSALQSRPSTKPTPARTGLGAVATDAAVRDEIYLSWVPESVLQKQKSEEYEAYLAVESRTDTDSPATRSIQASTITNEQYAFSIPVSSIYSILVRPPNLGWWFGSLVVSTRDGITYPALFFHDDECQSTILQRKRRQKESFDPFASDNGVVFWGGDEVLRWIRRYARVERSTVEPQLYLIDPESADVLSLSTRPTVTTKKAVGGGGEMKPLVATLKEARWGLLSTFAKVTSKARQLLESNKTLAESLPTPVQELLGHSPEARRVVEEFEQARLYLAKWAQGIHEREERAQMQQTTRVWGVEEVDADDLGEVGGAFELVRLGDVEDEERDGDRDQVKPVTKEVWEGFFDHTGRLMVTVREVKRAIFYGGLEDDVRSDAWMFLLGVYPWDSSSDERKAIMASKRDEYERLKGRAWCRANGVDVDGHVPTEEEKLALVEERHRIEKDVHRTDRTRDLFQAEDLPNPHYGEEEGSGHEKTNVHMEACKEILVAYHEYNPTLGYVQGMSDLLSPVYVILGDEAASFWAFVGFMERMQPNFLRDQSGMRRQLVVLDQLVQLMEPKLYKHLEKADSTNFFFFFRSLLVWFKREFEWHDVLRLWEVLWTDFRSKEYHLFFAFAVLERNKDAIMDNLQRFDEILKYMNDLSMNIDLELTLRRADVLFTRFQRTVEAIDLKRAEQERDSSSGLRRRLPAGEANTSGTGESETAQEAVKLPVITEGLRGLLAK